MSSGDLPVQLTEGCLQKIFNPQNNQNVQHVDGPIVQVLSIRDMPLQVEGADTPKRYRLVLSDGVHFSQGMLASQLNDFITKEILCKNGIIKMTHYICNSVNKKRHDVPRKGNPVILAKAPGCDQGVPEMKREHEAPRHEPWSEPVVKQENIKTSMITDRSPPLKSAVEKDDSTTVFKISEINPYLNRWKTCARVYNKSDLRSWAKPKGEGFVFSFTLIDESGEVKVTAFDNVAKKFYDIVQENKVYYLSKATIKAANKKFSSLNNQYEIILDANSEVTECLSQLDYPKMSYSFMQISDISEDDKDKIVDVIGVVTEVTEVSELVSKLTNKPFKKRDYVIVDKGLHPVRLTLFGNLSESVVAHPGDVIAIKSVKVGTYNGVSLSALRSSYVQLNPQIPEAQDLSSWYTSLGSEKQGITNISNLKTVDSYPQKQYILKEISQIKDENTGLDLKPAYVKIVSTITLVKRNNIAYPACQNTTCNKKVTNIGAEWLCERCNKRYDSPSYSVLASDHTGRVWLTMFNDEASKLIGRDAEEMVRLSQDDRHQFDEVLSTFMFKMYEFNVRIKAENIQDEQRMNLSVVSFDKVDHAKFAFQLCLKIGELSSRA